MMKPVLRVEKASKDAIKEGIFDPPFKSNKNMSTSITYAKTYF